MKLISIIDFVLETIADRSGSSTLDYRDYAYNKLLKIENYANFLKQPLTLGMFVPCDLEGDILKEPERCCCGDVCVNERGNCQDAYYEDNNEYQQAKERCLFEGFEVITKDFNKVPYKFCQNKYTYVYFYDELKSKWTKVNDCNTVDDLVLYNLQLTPTAIKQL